MKTKSLKITSILDVLDVHCDRMAYAGNPCITATLLVAYEDGEIVPFEIHATRQGGLGIWACRARTDELSEITDDFDERLNQVWEERA